MGLPERFNIFPCASMQLLWKSTTPNKGISETDSLSGPQNDVVFRGDVVSFEKEGADGLLRQLAADDLFVIVRGQSHFGAFEHKIHVEIDRQRRIGEMT